MKLCIKCGTKKPLSGFKSDRRRVNGITGRCKECSQVACRQWRLKHPEVEAGRKKRVRPDSKIRSRRWRKTNPERHRANDQAWRKANPEKARAIKATRLARKRGVSGKHTGEQIKTLMINQKAKCPNCLRSIKSKYHVDHIMPISLGGSNDIGNIQLLCPLCNLSKHSKLPELWAQENGRLL